MDRLFCARLLGRKPAVTAYRLAPNPPILRHRLLGTMPTRGVPTKGENAEAPLEAAWAAGLLFVKETFQELQTDRFCVELCATCARCRRSHAVVPANCDHPDVFETGLQL
jgi:hypothetical protein